MAIDNAMRAILDAAREYGFFVHRADVPAADWNYGDILPQNVWVDLDLTGIVPVNAHAVLFHGQLRANNVNYRLQLRRNGYTQDEVHSLILTQVAGINSNNDMIVGIGPDRIIQAHQGVAGPAWIDLTVKGWWY